MNSGIKDIYKIATVSGFTKKACQTLLDKAQKNMNDIKFITQLDSNFKENIEGHIYRGYTILGERNSTEIAYFQEKRPIWFLSTGYGGFWPGMGIDFMNVKPFKRSILRSAEVLKSEGVNLIDLIFNSTKNTFSNTIHTATLITAIQIALVDVYTSLGIKPDGIVGVSAGEAVAGYADGCLTFEQTILTAYWIGKIIKETELVPCSKAKISLNWEETEKLCPSDIYLTTSYNGHYLQVTGPTNSIKKFVDDLNRKHIEASFINYPVPFHTKYVAEAGVKIKERLEKIIPNPKEWSSKSLSTSVPETNWGTPAHRLCCADYFVNNLVKPVLLSETIKYVPANAITIQVNLDGRRWYVENFSKLIPGHTGVHTKVIDLLCHIGKLYNSGAQPDISKLYI